MKTQNIKLDSNNFRKHSDKNKRIINKSLKEFGVGRSILIDSENEIIAGNGVFEQTEKLNIPIKIIETDGNELIAIKRTDLKTSDDKRKGLALIDNHTSDTSEFDMSIVQDEFQEDFLNEWEFEITEPIKKETQELKPYHKNHILISYPLELHSDVMEVIEQLQKNEDIEIETGAN